jgi:predicted lactoylglutathione lyase
MSKMIFVNLPVRDLKASTAFYIALGATLNPQFSGEKSSCMMVSDTIGVMLLTHEHYRQPSARSATRGAKARRSLRSASRGATRSTPR